jgi:transposase
MGGYLLMSEGERLRKVILEGVREGRVALAAAALQLGVSYRHLRRIWKRYRTEGDPGLPHRGRGRPSNRSKPPSLRQRAIRRYRERYEGFGPTLACEKLAEEGVVLDHETLRRWLIREGLWAGPKAGVRHRAYRERKARFGEMLQLDGSPHRWFGPPHPEACLMDIVDDATGTTVSLLCAAESTENAMRVLKRWIERYGVPEALYTDRHTIYRSPKVPTREEQLAGRLPLSAFGAVCKRLGIRILTAHSPQAKGRVERKHGVYQDRFAKELRLLGITTIPEADALLHNGFADGLNRRFATPPADPIDAHRPIAPRQVEEAFYWESSRVLQNDFTLRNKNRHFQVLPGNRPLPRPDSCISVRQYLDGAVRLFLRDRELAFEEIPDRRPRVIQQGAPNIPNKPRIPAPDHPWRTGHQRPIRIESRP